MTTDFNNDGLCHHAEVLENLRCMQEMGVAKWISAKEERWHHPECGSQVDWYARTCRSCNDNCIREGHKGVKPTAESIEFLLYVKIPVFFYYGAFLFGPGLLKDYSLFQVGLCLPSVFRMGFLEIDPKRLYLASALMKDLGYHFLKNPMLNGMRATR
jgi:hypothetical protein